MLEKVQHDVRWRPLRLRRLSVWLRHLDLDRHLCRCRDLHSPLRQHRGLRICGHAQVNQPLLPEQRRLRAHTFGLPSCGPDVLADGEAAADDGAAHATA